MLIGNPLIGKLKCNCLSQVIQWKHKLGKSNVFNAEDRNNDKQARVEQMY